MPRMVAAALCDFADGKILASQVLRQSGPRNRSRQADPLFELSRFAERRR
jgi:hypothetical protein